MGLIRTLRRDLKGLPKYFNLSTWIMRILLFVYVITFYGKRFTYFDFDSEYFILSLIYILCSFLIIIGGFSKTSELTRFAAIAMLIIAIAHMAASFLVFKSMNEYYASNFLFIAVILYFVTASKRYDYYYRSQFERDKLDEEEESIRTKHS